MTESCQGIRQIPSVNATGNKFWQKNVGIGLDVESLQSFGIAENLMERPGSPILMNIFTEVSVIGGSNFRH